MRRLAIAFIIILAILAIGWTAAWFMVAAWAERKSASVLAELDRRGIGIRCEERGIVGFPFAIAIACADTEVVETRSGSTATLAGIEGGASLFSPRTAQIELFAPARLQSPLVPGPIELGWTDAAVNIGIGMGGPRSIGFDAEDFAASMPAGSVQGEDAEGRLAPSEDGGSTAELSFEQLELTAGGTSYPPVDGRIAAQLSMPPRALLSGRAALQPPFTARIAEAELAHGEARLAAAGDITVDAEGILDGTVTVRLAGAEGLGALIAALPPDQQRAGNAVAGAVLAFGNPTELDGAPASELTVAIERGRAKVGMFEVDLPRWPL